jgi:hypothetical protein
MNWIANIIFLHIGETIVWASFNTDDWYKEIQQYIWQKASEHKIIPTPPISWGYPHLVLSAQSHQYEWKLYLQFNSFYPLMICVMDDLCCLINSYFGIVIDSETCSVQGLIILNSLLIWLINLFQVKIMCYINACNIRVL